MGGGDGEGGGDEGGGRVGGAWVAALMDPLVFCLDFPLPFLLSVLVGFR